ncbi:hypothetical protein ACV3UL_08425 [Clostridium perfringens]
MDNISLDDNKINDETVKELLKALEEKFNNEKAVYEKALEDVQNLCSHKNMIPILVGGKCTVCGKIFSNYK